MADGKKGREFTFHGAFGSKDKAKTREKKVHGFIREIKVRGSKRFVVMTRNK